MMVVLPTPFGEMECGGFLHRPNTRATSQSSGLETKNEEVAPERLRCGKIKEVS